MKVWKMKNGKSTSLRKIRRTLTPEEETVEKTNTVTPGKDTKGKIENLPPSRKKKKIKMKRMTIGCKRLPAISARRKDTSQTNVPIWEKIQHLEIGKRKISKAVEFMKFRIERTPQQ